MGMSAATAQAASLLVWRDLAYIQRVGKDVLVLAYNIRS